MRREIFVWGVVILAGSWTSSSAGAQSSGSTRLRDVFQIDRIGEAGQRLLEGIFPPLEPSKARQTVPAPGRAEFDRATGARRPSSTSRSGTAVGSYRNPTASRAAGSGTTSAAGPLSTRTYAPRSSGGPVGRMQRQASAPSGASGSSASVGQSASSGQSPSTTPLQRRLHERLALFRESAFIDDSQPESEAGEPPTDPSRRPTSQGSIFSGPTPAPTKGVDRPTVRQPFASGITGGRLHSGGDRPAGQSSLGQLSIGGRVSIQAGAEASADEPANEGSQTAGEPAPKRPTPAPSTGDPTVDDAQPSTPAVTPEVPSETKATTSVDDRVLFSRQSPILDVKTIGPRRITVGKESVYEVTIYNSGPVAADGVVVTVDLPDWADVQDATASAGAAEAATSAAAGQPFRWTVGRLEAKGQERLVLGIVPRESRRLDLGVTWDYTPVATQAVIEVQQPKLEMRLDGPREVLYGKRELYRLELINAGNGDAESVEISLSPVGAGKNLPATHKLGTIAAGEKKVVEVELTARQTGTLTVNVDARGDGGVQAHLSEQILILRPGLKVNLQAPEVQYVDTEATYEVRVSNPGTAASENVQVTVAIPPTATYVSCIRDGQLAADRSQITWTLDSLAPGKQETFSVTCRLDQAGPCRLEVQSAADGNLTASAEATTLVETIADLVLDVDDPAGPVAVGVQTTYQVAVQNRGSRTAEDIEVVAYFSRGIEPTSAEGAPHKIAPGQVVFERIPSLSAGENVVLKVHAKAEAAGNHIFRVEVYCKESGIRLVSEDMTHFYNRPGFERASEGTKDPPSQVVRTAERRQSTVAPSGTAQPTPGAGAPE